MRVTFGLVVVVGSLGAAGLSVSAQAPQSQWSGVYSAEQAARGEKTFQDRCSPCHGGDAAGGFSGGDVGRGPALIGKEFATDWNERTLADLFEKIHVDMPMDKPGSLSNQQVVDVMAFLLKTDSYPVGKTDLPADPVQLKAYKFLAKDPTVK